MIILKEKTACFTGHRRLPQKIVPQIKESLEHEIEKLIERGIIYFGCGGAIGFDTLAGYTILKLKIKYPFIKLIMVLPCHNQDEKWSKIEKLKYRHLLDNAEKTVNITDEYTNKCMHQRNRHLIDHSKYCLAYLVQSSGGTFYTVHYAHEHGLEVINIADKL